MNNKDILKILLCYHGYDRNIEIKTYHADGGWIGYDVHAENQEGGLYEEMNCEGIIFHIHCILEFMKENKIESKSKWWDVPIKYLLKDELRKESIDQWDKQEARTKEFIEKTKPLDEWRKKNNPCPNCTINKKDHWDTIHYNCELCHTQSCEILKSFESGYKTFRDDFMNKLQQEEKQNDKNL